MNAIKINYKLIFRICLLAVCIVFACYFPNIILYVFLSFIFALLGKPLANRISKIKIFKKNIPHTVSSIIVVALFVIIFMVAMLFFIPLLIKELRVLQNVDYDAIILYFDNLIMSIQAFLYDNNFISESETLIGLFTDKVKGLVDLNVIGDLVGNIINSTGSFFFGLFAVIFITFFFIKDDIRLINIISVFFNKEYIDRVTHVSDKINDSLSKYCGVTLINTFIMIIMLYIVLAILGVKGAFLMAVIGGVLNIIPYIGPILGGAISCIFGIINCIGLGMYTSIFPLILKIVLTYVGVNLVNNTVVLTLMYSKSIKLHPIESFLITIIGGNIGGMAGMLLGIPVYTIIKIVVLEIYKFVNSDDNRIIMADKISQE